MRRLGVVGLVSLDRVDGGLPRLGGAPYYAARALRLLGREGAIATKTAPEERGRLNAIGMPVAWRPAARTIAFRIENRGDRRAIALEETGEPWTPDEAEGWLAEALLGVDLVHAGALARADFSASTLAALRRGRRLSLDGQALVRPAESGELGPDAAFDADILRHVDMLKLSAEEADALGLEMDERSLGSLGVAEVVVTLGRRGAVVYADGLAEYVPAHPLEVADPTGAGDAFAAAYLSHRLARHAPRSAAAFANQAVAALFRDRRR